MKYLAHAALILLVVSVLFGCSTAPVDAPPEVTRASAENSGGVTSRARTTLLPPTPTPHVSPRPLDSARPDAETERQSIQQEKRTTARTTPSATITRASRQPFEGAELYVHLPPQAHSRQPLRIFLALHGMGNRGEAFSQNLIKIAEANNWVLVAPTLPYGDYFDPQQLREDDLTLSRRLVDTLDVLPQRLNLKFYRQVLIYGYSRGAQLGHRFTYFYPERVKSIAVLSAGAYTMPTEQVASGKGTPTIVPFPYGVGDLQECVGKPINWQALKQVSFWVGVGERDNQPNDVARAFDPYGGRTRVERAESFKQALQNLGIKVSLVVFPNVSHELVPEMRARALQFLRDEELADPLDH